MDKMTLKMLTEASLRNPRKIIRSTHMFLDGYNGHPCGLVPNDCDGDLVELDYEYMMKYRYNILNRDKPKPSEEDIEIARKMIEIFPIRKCY